MHTTYINNFCCFLQSPSPLLAAVLTSTHHLTVLTTPHHLEVLPLTATSTPSESTGLLHRQLVTDWPSSLSASQENYMNRFGLAVALDLNGRYLV